MNKKFLPTQKMLFQFNDFVSVYRAKLEAIPFLWEVISLMLTWGVSFNVAIRVQSADYGGYALTKKQKKVKLAHSLITVLNLLYNACLKTNQIDDIKNFRSTLSKLLQLSYVKILEKGKSTVEYCDSHAEDLLAMGISEEMLLALKVDTETLETYIPLPQEMKKKKELATQEIEIHGNNIDQLQTDRLDKLMESLFKTTEPQLYADYRQAVKREHTASRKIAFMGSIKSKTTQEPISNAHVLIPQAGIDHLCQGAKGGFRIPNLEAGTYEVEVNAVNFITKKLTLVHNYGETDKLDIILEPESEVEKV